jgi:general stress protein 26
MKNFLGSMAHKAKSFLGKALNAAPHIHNAVSMGFKAVKHLAPIFKHEGATKAIADTETKYHQWANKLRQYYQQNESHPALKHITS